MISVYISIVLFSFQWLFKSYISKLLWTDFSITLPITSRMSELSTSRITFSELSYAMCTSINAVGTKVQFAFAVPVSGLIPQEKWRLFPASELQLSLVPPHPPPYSRVKAPSFRWVFKSFKSGKTFRHNISLPYLCLYTMRK